MFTAISRDGVSPCLTPGVMMALMRGRPPAQPIKDFPNRLREWRVARGLSQQQLADRTGHKPQSIARHETGENQITLAQMEIYARALEIKPEELLNGSLRINPSLRGIIQTFDALPPEQQDNLLRVWHALAPVQSELPPAVSALRRR